MKLSLKTPNIFSKFEIEKSMSCFNNFNKIRVIVHMYVYIVTMIVYMNIKFTHTLTLCSYNINDNNKTRLFTI